MDHRKRKEFHKINIEENLRKEGTDHREHYEVPNRIKRMRGIVQWRQK